MKKTKGGRMDNFEVAVRIRNINDFEANGDASPLYSNAHRWKIDQGKNAVFLSTDKGVALPAKTGRTYFKYTRAFDGEATNSEVYGVCQKAVKSFLKGVNSTVIAFGQTSTGKTFTMQGGVSATDNQTHEGIIQMAAFDIFDHLQNLPESTYTLRLSAFEVYNQDINDLLINKVVSSRQDPETRLLLDVSEQVVTDYADFIDLINLCNERRSVRQTYINEDSSRSHVIYSMSLECSAYDQDRPFESNLYLVDLAGNDSSLRNKKKIDGQQQTESNYINKRLVNQLIEIYTSKIPYEFQLSLTFHNLSFHILGSLLSLSNVIMGLSRKTFVNFRNSVLTRILQPFLDGKAQVVLICCASPSGMFSDSTRKTLEFGLYARQIKCQTQINYVAASHLLTFDSHNQQNMQGKRKVASPPIKKKTSKKREEDVIYHESYDPPAKITVDDKMNLIEEQWKSIRQDYQSLPASPLSYSTDKDVEMSEIEEQWRSIRKENESKIKQSPPKKSDKNSEMLEIEQQWESMKHSQESSSSPQPQTKKTVMSSNEEQQKSFAQGRTVSPQAHEMNIDNIANISQVEDSHYKDKDSLPETLDSNIDNNTEASEVEEQSTPPKDSPSQMPQPMVNVSVAKDIEIPHSRELVDEKPRGESLSPPTLKTDKISNIWTQQGKEQYKKDLQDVQPPHPIRVVSQDEDQLKSTEHNNDASLSLSLTNDVHNLAREYEKMKIESKIDDTYFFISDDDDDESLMSGSAFSNLCSDSDDGSNGPDVKTIGTPLMGRNEDVNGSGAEVETPTFQLDEGDKIKKIVGAPSQSSNSTMNVTPPATEVKTMLNDFHSLDDDSRRSISYHAGMTSNSNRDEVFSNALSDQGGKDDFLEICNNEAIDPTDSHELDKESGKTVLSSNETGNEIIKNQKTSPTTEQTIEKYNINIESEKGKARGDSNKSSNAQKETALIDSTIREDMEAVITEANGSFQGTSVCTSEENTEVAAIQVQEENIETEIPIIVDLKQRNESTGTRCENDGRFNTAFLEKVPLARDGELSDCEGSIIDDSLSLNSESETGSLSYKVEDNDVDKIENSVNVNMVELSSKSRESPTYSKEPVSIEAEVLSPIGEEQDKTLTKGNACDSDKNNIIAPIDSTNSNMTLNDNAQAETGFQNSQPSPYSETRNAVMLSGDNRQSQIRNEEAFKGENDDTEDMEVHLSYSEDSVGQKPQLQLGDDEANWETTGVRIESKLNLSNLNNRTQDEVSPSPSTIDEVDSSSEKDFGDDFSGKSSDNSADSFSENRSTNGLESENVTHSDLLAYVVQNKTDQLQSEMEKLQEENDVLMKMITLVREKRSSEDEECLSETGGAPLSHYSINPNEHERSEVIMSQKSGESTLDNNLANDARQEQENPRRFGPVDQAREGIPTMASAPDNVSVPISNTDGDFQKQGLSKKMQKDEPEKQMVNNKSAYNGEENKENGVQSQVIRSQGGQLQSNLQTSMSIFEETLQRTLRQEERILQRWEDLSGDFRTYRRRWAQTLYQHKLVANPNDE